MALYGAFAVLAPHAVFAEQAPNRTQVYAIAAGDLRAALDAFAMQGDIQLVYDPATVAGKRTRGVSGRFLPGDALQQLLRGTGLNGKALNPTTFVLEAQAAFHPPQNKPTESAREEKPRTLNPVTVSGSLIANADIQTATPTFTVTAAEIRARGFNNLADALQNLVLATGSVQGQQAAGSFTQGAQPVSLFGLGPQFTLILLDGKPIANFGRLYNGTFNFTSVANLPVAIIDRIDVMPGGASSIYGSQAIGGVINIVTRSRLEGSELSVRAGGYTDGGGANQRISAAYGHDAEKWRVLGTIEFDNVSPIWGYQRPLTKTSNGMPDMQAGIFDYGSASSFTGMPLAYHSPPDGCASGLFGGSTRPTAGGTLNIPGTYCGSNRVVGYTTFGNQIRTIDGMLKLAYRLGDNTWLYGDGMANCQQQRWFPSVTAWSTDDLPHGLLEDTSTGRYLYFRKLFAPEEMPGGAAGQMYRQHDLLYQADIGVRGQWGDSGWRWDIYYLRTGDRTDVVEPLSVKANIDGLFENTLGPLVGHDPQTGIAMYNPDYPALFRAITPAQYAGFTRDVTESSNTWINDTRATLSHASLFALPGGDAGFAALVEGGNEAWYAPISPLFVNGDIYEHAAAGGGGRRSHAATALELNLPLLKPLALDLSGRYDYYALDHGSDNRKFTYKIGVEYRPASALLIRGNYTTSFKAPDLSSIFLGPTDYYSFITDYYLCARAHSTACGTAYQYEVQGTSQANPALQPTSAQSWSLGTVWSPLDSLAFSVDYLHIAIRNEVVQQDLDLLMRTDAQCLLGQQDINAAECRAATGQVRRAAGSGPVTGVTTYYANLADEVTKSVIGTARYRFAFFDLGMLDLKLDYNDMLKHSYQIAPGEPSINQLANALYSTEFKSIASGSIGWTSTDARWAGTLYGHRYSPSPNYVAASNGIGYPGAARVAPWITLNASVTYRPTRRLALSLLVNNIANKMPPRDTGYAIYPYFNYDNYNIYGREILLQADLRTGQ